MEQVLDSRLKTKKSVNLKSVVFMSSPFSSALCFARDALTCVSAFRLPSKSVTESLENLLDLPSSSTQGQLE
jgi:hypothetical protein